ncbi:hypothetical protein C7B80_20355, partial [Cyanosarcina cf. burmensis CCALA 770]
TRWMYRALLKCIYLSILFSLSTTVILSRTASTLVTPTVEVQYTLGNLPEGLPSGTGIYASISGALPEQIAALPGISPETLDLSADYFQFI